MDGALGEQATLQLLLRNARAMLLDFDGPVTDLFGDESTAPVADEIKKTVRDIWGPLDPDVEECDDSHGILRHLKDMYDRPAAAPRDALALREADAIVTRYEYDAVKRAEPTPDVLRLIDTLYDCDLRLAIVSNNAEGPIREFLAKVKRQGKFDAVVGRDPLQQRRMKPAPDSVRHARNLLDLPARQTLLIGDQLTDLQAAREAGTAFLGHTTSGRRALEMKDRKAQCVVHSHAQIIDVARSLPSRHDESTCAD